MFSIKIVQQKLSIKDSSRSLLFTLEIIWIIFLSIFGNFIFNQKINFKWEIKWCILLQFVLLILGIFFYGILLFHFRSCYYSAEEKNRINYYEWIRSNKTIQRKKIDYFFWKIFSKKKICWAIFSFLCLLLHLYLNSQQ